MRTPDFIFKRLHEKGLTLKELVSYMGTSDTTFRVIISGEKTKNRSTSRDVAIARLKELLGKSWVEKHFVL